MHIFLLFELRKAIEQTDLHEIPKVSDEMKLDSLKSILSNWHESFIFREFIERLEEVGEVIAHLNPQAQTILLPLLWDSRIRMTCCKLAHSQTKKAFILDFDHFCCYRDSNWARKTLLFVRFFAHQRYCFEKMKKKLSK